MHKIVHKYLKHQGINIASRYLEDLIVSNANFPSILCIADVLERLSISCSIGKINKTDLIGLEFPYILHLESEEGDLVFVKNKKSLHKQKEKLKGWNGTVIKIFPERGVRTQKNEDVLRKENLTKRMISFLLISVFGLLLISKTTYHLEWDEALLLLSAIVGSITGYLLLTKDLGIENIVVEKFCQTVKGKKSGCDQVLNSKTAQIFGKVKLSDLVFTYFSFQIILIGSSNYFDVSYYILPIVGFITGPIILFSLYYQYFTAKTWCQLCLVINAILILQLVMYSFNTSVSFENTSIQPLALVASLLIFISLLSSTVLIKNGHKELRDSRLSLYDYKRIFESVTVFKFLLQKQRKIKTNPILKEIVLGNATAPIKVLMVSNLYCEPCKIQHKILEELLLTYPEKLQVSFRFVLNNKEGYHDITATDYIISYWLKNIEGKVNAVDITLEMLSDWYDLMNLKKFMFLYPLKKNDVIEKDKATEEAFFNWLHESRIEKTPTIFVNGYLLPDQYTLENLAAIIPELSESIYNNQLPKEKIIFEEI
ncbi:vitamin K epoxide reductase family protein [Aquimarina sp. 2201CG1-2-11]|uniref:vitamin K epoxide reductase family protein n=1 Tax=Aquimarina discodermiae TaxID=3231043 RepID=UPI0034622FB2